MMSIKKGLYITLSLLMVDAAIADSLELSCSGERYENYSKEYSPYNFTASVDLKANKISIRQFGVVYQKGNTTWNKERCPNQEWLAEITDESFKTSSICHTGDPKYNKHIWHINRSDGSFYTSSFRDSSKGFCVKATDKAF